MSLTKSRTASRPSRVSAARTIAKGLRERLTELRIEHDLTVDRFAERIAAKPTTVRDWLNARVLPRADALVGIARSFGVSIDWLLGIDGATKNPTQWRSESDFAADLSSAIVDGVRRRGGAAADLLEEFEVDGGAALESLATSAEDAILSRAEHRAKWVAQRDALVALNGEREDLAKLVAALATAELPTAAEPKAERALVHRRQSAQRTLEALPRKSSSILKAVTLAQAALQSVVSENGAPVGMEAQRTRDFVKIATSKALQRDVDRYRRDAESEGGRVELRDIDQQLIDADLAASRRIAVRYRSATRKASRNT